MYVVQKKSWPQESGRDCVLQGKLVSSQFVELDGALGQDLPPGFFREFLSDHRWCPREEPVKMRIIGGPDDFVRAQVLRQVC